MTLKISKEPNKDSNTKQADGSTSTTGQTDTNQQGKTAKTNPTNPKKPTNKGKTIMGLQPFTFWVAVGSGVVFLLIVITVGVALMVGKNEPPPDKQEQPPAEMTTEETGETENKENPAENVFQINPALLAHYQAKNQESGQYWAIVREVVNADTGAMERSNPFRLVVNQAVDKVIMQTGFYTPANGGGITTTDGKDIIAFSDPTFKQFYMQAVDTVLTEISGRYDVRTEKVVFNEGANLTEVAIVIIKEPSGNVDIETPELLMQFENEVISVASNVVPPLITQMQQQYENSRPKDKEQGADDQSSQVERERQAEQARIEKAKMEAEIEKSKQVISQLEQNLQDTRHALVQSEESHNKTKIAMHEQDKRMGDFIQRLEKQPSVNHKLNLVTIDEQKHGLKTTAVVGDRIFFQDKMGEQYTASVGDVIVLQDGKKLVLVDAENKKVVVE